MLWLRSVVASALLAFPCWVNAGLLVAQDDETVLDMSLMIVFTQNANLLNSAVGQRNQYDSVVANLADLNSTKFNGRSSWRLPTSAELAHLHREHLGELGSFFQGDFNWFTFTSLPPFGDNGRLVQGYDVARGVASTLVRGQNTAYGWAVSDQVAVPSPGSITLIGLGLLCLRLYRGALLKLS